MLSSGKLTAPMRVSVSLKQNPPAAKPAGPSAAHLPRHVVAPDGRMSPTRSGVVSPQRHLLVQPQAPTSPTSPSRPGNLGSPVAARPVVAGTRPAVTASHRGGVGSASAAPTTGSAFAPPVRPVVSVTAPAPVQAGKGGRALASPKHLSPTKLQSPGAAPAAAASPSGPPKQRAATMTSTLRTGDSISPEGEDKPKDSGGAATFPSTVVGVRLQTRRKIGNKTPEVEKFLVESLRRDPGSGQAQLNEADLQQLLGSGVMIDGFFLKESERQKGDGSFTADLLELVTAHRGVRHDLGDGDQGQLTEIKRFFEQQRGSKPLDTAVRCYRNPWLKDWYQGGENTDQDWYCLDQERWMLYEYIFFLYRVKLPTFLCEPQPVKSRPFIYVQVPVDLTKIPDDHEYLRLQPEARHWNLIPQALKCDFLEPFVHALAWASARRIESATSSHLVLILDSSGYSCHLGGHTLSFRISVPEFCVSRQTALNVAKDAVQFLRRRRLASEPWVNLENVESIARLLEPFALLHVVLDGDRFEYEPLETRCHQGRRAHQKPQAGGVDSPGLHVVRESVRVGDGVGGASGYIFVVDNGSFEVRIDGAPVATLGRGCTFGWNFLMNQPQSSSVFACSKSSLWGADGQKIQQMITDRTRERIDQNRKLLDCVSMFKGLPPRQIELLSSAIAEQTVPAGEKVVQKGELSTALYFIRSGTLLVEENKKELGPGDFFGERALLHHAPRSATVSAVTEAELLRLEAESLKSVVGPDLMVYLSRSLILEALKSSQSCGQFNASQQSSILQKMNICEVPENSVISQTKAETFVLLAAWPWCKAPSTRGLRGAKRPLWVHESGRIYFESFHVQAAQVADFLIAIAEPVSRPQVIHEYQITSLSLTAAIANGISVEQIIKVLVKLSKNDEQLLRQLKTHEEVAECVVDAASSEVDSLKVEKLKAAAHQLGFPLLQADGEYEFRRDRAEGNPPLPAVLRPNVNLRPYQQRALAKMFSVEEVAKSGIVVLPCGAGKTLLGIAACCRVGRRALVLTTTAVAVDQWRRQLQMYTTLPPEEP
eukprot:g27694.t1